MNRIICGTERQNHKAVDTGMTKKTKEKKTETTENPLFSVFVLHSSLSAHANENTVCHLLQMEGNPTSHHCSVCQLGSRTYRSVPLSVSRLRMIRRSWPVESFNLCTFPADRNSSTLSFLWAYAGADKSPLCIWNESYLRIGCYYGRDNESALRLLNVGSKGFVNLRRITVSSL